MSEAKVRGKVHLIEETKTFGASGFRKRLVVLEQENGRFTNYVPVEFTREACDSVDDLATGDDVEINYVLSGRKWQRDPQSEVKFFVNLEAVSFKKIAAGGATTASGTLGTGQDAANDAFAENYDDGDVPF